MYVRHQARGLYLHDITEKLTLSPTYSEWQSTYSNLGVTIKPMFFPLYLNGMRKLSLNSQWSIHYFFRYQVIMKKVLWSCYFVRFLWKIIWILMNHECRIKSLLFFKHYSIACYMLIPKPKIDSPANTESSYLLSNTNCSTMLSTRKLLKTTKRHRKTFGSRNNIYYPSSTEGKNSNRLPKNSKNKIKQCTYMYLVIMNATKAVIAFAFACYYSTSSWGNAWHILGTQQIYLQ